MHHHDASANLQGEWLDNKKHGFFVILYSNGEKFEGHFMNDKRNGEGTHFYSDGSKVEKCNSTCSKNNCEHNHKRQYQQ